MPNRNRMFTRLAERLCDYGISIDRITWLTGVGEDDNGVRDYLREEVLDQTEERLGAIFGREQGAFLNVLCEVGKTDEAVDELLLRGGWLVQASFRQPNPKTVNFRDNEPYSWTPSPWLSFHYFHHRNLNVALCKALLWGARLEMRAFAEARRIQEGRP